MKLYYPLKLAATIVLCSVVSSNCLAQPTYSRNHRVGGIGLTFLLPTEFFQCEIPEEEGTLLRWSTEKIQVTYSRDWMLNWKAEDSGGDNPCDEDFVHADVKVAFSSDPIGITLKIRSPESFGGVDYISISGGSAAEVCSITVDILNSFEVSNLASRIKVDYIAPGAEYFVLVNEVGQVRAAKVGDIVTRNEGEVVEISHRSVRIVELAPDGVGGFSEVPIIVKWTQTHGGTADD